AASLAQAPAPQEMPAPNPVGAPGAAAFGGLGNGSSMVPTLLAYDGEMDQGFLATAQDAPELPIQPVQTRFGVTIHVHVPAEDGRFSVASAAPGTGSAEVLAPDQAALAFVEDLIQLGRIDF